MALRPVESDGATAIVRAIEEAGGTLLIRDVFLLIAELPDGVRSSERSLSSGSTAAGWPRS